MGARHEQFVKISHPGLYLRQTARALYDILARVISTTYYIVTNKASKELFNTHRIVWTSARRDNVMLGTRYTVRLALVLVVGCCLALGQRIDVDDGATCTYSFAVQSRLCTRDPASKAEVVALYENVGQLRNQIAQMARKI